MKNYNNLIPKENFKQVAEVRYLDKQENYKTPTYEEFMNTYKHDEKVIENYENEISSYSDIGVNRGYGPATHGDLACHGNSLTFRLKVEITNFAPSLNLSETFHSPEKALCAISNIISCRNGWENGSWYDTGSVSNEVREAAANSIRDAVQWYNLGHRVDGYIFIKGKFLGGWESTTKY